MYAPKTRNKHNIDYAFPTNAIKHLINSTSRWYGAPTNADNTHPFTFDIDLFTC